MRIGSEEIVSYTAFDLELLTCEIMITQKAISQKLKATYIQETPKVNTA